jgi:hypothetical protein
VRTSGSDFIYYPFHTPRGSYGGTSWSYAPLDSNGGSWLGKKVIVQNNGTFLFDNIWNDTAVIKSQAHVGETWIFYNDTSAIYYTAQLTTKDTVTIFGALDSIKKILITAHNSSGPVSTDPVDSFTIILSKDHGFTQVFDLQTFPYHKPDSAYVIGLDYYLDYIVMMRAPLMPTSTNSIFSLIDLVNPTFAQLTQWNVGDVYEYGSCYGFRDHVSSLCIPVEDYNLDTITSSMVLTGGIQYNYTGWVAQHSGSTMTGPDFYSKYPVSSSETFYSTNVIDTNYMPEEYGHANLYGYNINDSSYCITGTLYSILGYGPNGFINGVEHFPVFEYFVEPTKYKAPLGLLTRKNVSHYSIGYQVQSKDLLYYNRGGVTCGTLHTPPTAIKDIDVPGNEVFLTPNPATNILTINGTNRITQLVIINLIGQTIYSNTPNTEKAEVNVSNLPSGIYLIRINDTIIKKFVKE